MNRLGFHSSQNLFAVAPNYFHTVVLPLHKFRQILVNALVLLLKIFFDKTNVNLREFFNHLVTIFIL